MRAKLAALATLVAASSLFSQEQPPLVESIEVRVANVDVVVRDRHGNPVPGLTKDDFDLIVDGARKNITNFYEVRRGRDESPDALAQSEVPVEVRQKRIVVFVDTASLTPSLKKAVLESLDRYLDRLRPEDLCMLVSYRAQVEVVTPFTHDRQALARGVKAISHYSAAGERSAESVSTIRRIIQSQISNAEENLVTWQEAYATTRTIVDRYSERLIAEEREVAGAVDEVTADIAGLEGKKVLVFVGEQLPKKPGADLYRYINEQIGTHIASGQSNWFETAMGQPGNDFTSQIENMAQEASARGVTIYAIGASTTDSDISADERRPVDVEYNFARDSNTASALQSVASITGGVAITRSSNFDLAFDTIDRDLSSYYSIGYKPDGVSSRRHTIEVKAKNSQYSVRTRQTFVVQSTDDQMADRVVANLYIDSMTKNDWRISVRTAPPKRDGKNFVVPIEVEIPSTMTMIPQQDALAGSFILYFAVGDAQGKTSTVMRRPEDLRIPATSETTVRAKPMKFRSALRVKPGECVLSVAIFDQLSGAMGFARTKINARDATSHPPSASD